MQICDLLKIVEPLAALYKSVAQRERLVSLHVLPRVKPALQGGLYMPRLCDIQYGELYIDRISAAYRWELQRTILTRLSAIQ